MENLKNKTKAELIQIIESFQTTKNEINLPELLSSMQDFIFVFDKEQHFTFVNVPESSNLYLNTEKFIGKKHADVMPSEINDKFQIAFEKNKIGEFDSFEYQLNLNNQKFDFSSRMSPIYKKGLFSGSIAIVSNITQENITRKALVLEVEFSTKILETSSAVIVGLDKNHLIQLFNKGAEKISGYKAKEVIGKDWFKIFFPENIFNELSIVWKKHWGVKNAVNTNAISIKSGEERMISWQTTGFYDDDDDSNHLLISIGEDITDRENAEAKLRIERDNMKNIFEAMEDGIYIVNQEFDIEYVNHVLTKDIGDYKGKKCYNYFHDRTEVCPWCKNDEVFAGKTVHWEWHLPKTGKTYDLMDTPIKNSDGSISKLEIFRDISHHVAHKKELIKNEQKFRLLADYTYDWEYWIDTNSQYIYLSPSCERITGYTPDEFKNNPNLLYDMIHPDYKEKIHMHYHDENNKNTPVTTMDFPIINKAGKKVWINHNCNPVFDEKGKFTGRRGNNRDVTVEIIAEQKLIESEEKYRLIIENQNDLVVKLNLDYEITFINQNYCNTFGKTEKEIINNGFFPLIHKDDVDIVQNSLKKLLSPPYKCNHEERAETVYGWRWFTWSNKAVLDKNGKVAEFIAVGRDITDRKKVEEKLNREHEIFKAIVNNIPVMLTRYDPSDNFLFLNKEMENILGWTSEEAATVDFMAEVYPDPYYRKQAEAYMEKEGNTWKEFNVCAKNNEMIASEWSNVKLKDGTQIGIGIDIRKKKKAEQELKISEGKFRNFFESNQAVMLEINPKTKRIINCNKKAVEFYGYEKKELLTKLMYEINVLPKKEIDKKMKSALMQAAHFARFQHKIADTSIRDVDIYASPVTVKGERNMFVIVLDITENLKNEKELEVYRNNLEKLVKERTEEIETKNEELSEANKKLEEFNELFIGREFRIKELRDKIKKMEGK